MNANLSEKQAQDTVYALATSPDFVEERRCYAARQSGLFISDDGGLTWQTAFEALSATAVAVSPKGHMFAGVLGGILHSFGGDGGNTWKTAVLPPPPPLITALAASPDGRMVLAGTMEDGVFLSDDGGSGWDAWNAGLLDRHILCMALSPCFSTDRHVYVGSETGIYGSRNQGRSWRALNFPPEFAPILSIALSPGFFSDGILWAGTENQGLFCSEDYGQTWLPSKLTGSVNAIILSPQFPHKPTILVWMDNSLLLSHDGGQEWLPLDTSPVSGRLSAVAAPMGLEDGSVLLLGTQEGTITRLILR
jgi:photosystem II stability/assembly factor-like uncharacterized protein